MPNWARSCGVGGGPVRRRRHWRRVAASFANGGKRQGAVAMATAYGGGRAVGSTGRFIDLLRRTPGWRQRRPRPHHPPDWTTRGQ